MSDLVYFNVNEEAVTYDMHSSPEAALKVLEQFPNDMVIVVTAHSPAAKKLSDDLVATHGR